MTTTIDSTFSADLRQQLRSLLAREGQADDLPALLELAWALCSAGDVEAALAAFESVAGALATCEPAHLPVWHAITGLRLQLGLPGAALDACNQACRGAPDDPEVLFNLGVVLASVEDRAGAVAAYRRVLGIDPLHLGAALNLVGSLIAEGMAADALIAADSAIERHSGAADCWFNHGEALLSCGRPELAIESYVRAQKLCPGMTKAAIAVAFCKAAVGDLAASSASFSAIASQAPAELAAFRSPLETDRESAYPELEAGRIALISAYMKHRICDWSDRERFADLFSRVLRGDGCRPLDNPDLPYLSVGLPLSAHLRLQAARQVANRLTEEVRHCFPPIRPKRRLGQRIRVGYISGDFRRHATAFLMSRLPSLHDRARFKVFLYSTGPDDGSAIRREIVEGADCFCDLQRFDVSTTAQRIAMDGIDILVDLSGYTLHARTAALALRPAPVQVSYLAYLQTMGAPWVDYAMLDRTVLLPDERAAWDERIAYLPDTLYICDDRPLPVTTGDRDVHGLPQDAFVFCCLNAPRKNDPESFACWMEILRRCPGAVLWLYDDSGFAASKLRAEAANAGVDPARLVFTGKMSHEDHLARFACADLFLDSFGYNAHTTCIEALATGLPVLTVPGTSVVARVAASLLQAHGLPELVMADMACYVENACAIAGDRSRLEALREKVRQRGQSALFCTRRRVQEIERVFEMMWARHVSGLPPEDFDVPRLER